MSLRQSHDYGGNMKHPQATRWAGYYGWEELKTERSNMGYGFGVLNGYAARIFANAKAKGFHEHAPVFGKGGQDTRHILSWLMLVTTEVAEAAEAVRHGDKENFAEELADICIRVFDCAEALGISIEQEIVNKMAKNEARPHKHGGKLA